jgi:hypothetical protein
MRQLPSWSPRSPPEALEFSDSRRKADGHLCSTMREIMTYRPTGIGGFGFSINWEKEPGDEDVARRVVTFLENRRLLFGERHCEDELECVHSAIEIRNRLTDELAQAKPGKSLDGSIRAMRVAFREFVEAAGPGARNFMQRYGFPGMDPFSTALEKLRTLVGLHLQVIADRYDINIEPDLAQILPPDVSDDDDLSILPGWEDLR